MPHPVAPNVEARRRADRSVRWGALLGSYICLHSNTRKGAVATAIAANWPCTGTP